MQDLETICREKTDRILAELELSYRADELERLQELSSGTPDAFKKRTPTLPLGNCLKEALRLGFNDNSIDLLLTEQAKRAAREVRLILENGEYNPQIETALYLTVQNFRNITQLIDNITTEIGSGREQILNYLPLVLAEITRRMNTPIGNMYWHRTALFDFYELSEERKTVFREFVRHMFSIGYKIPKDKRKTRESTSRTVGLTEDVHLVNTMSAPELLIALLHDNKKERKADGGIDSSPRQIPPPKTRSRLFSVLTYYDYNSFSNDGLSLLEKYVDVLGIDYPNDETALECLEIGFDNVKHEIERLKATDKDHGYGKDPTLRLDELRDLLLVEPQHREFYDLVKVILSGTHVVSDSDIEDLKAIRDNKNIKKEYYNFFENMFRGLIQGEDAGRGIKKFGRAIDAINYGEIESSDELRDCTSFDIQGYSVICRIGEGGTRRVYKVKREGKDHILALKLDKDGEEITNPRARVVLGEYPLTELSEREIGVLKELTHENIARLWDYGNYNGRQYIVEDYVDGKDLEDRVRERGPLSHDEFVLVFGPVSRAINYIQQKNYLHRDIKPKNILVSDDLKTVKLTDLQNTVKGDEIGYYEGKGFGSVKVMPPETIMLGAFWPYSDFFSLGVSMYYAITGEYPFEYGDRFTIRALRKRVAKVHSDSRIRKRIEGKIKNYFKGSDLEFMGEGIFFFLTLCAIGLRPMGSKRYFSRLDEMYEGLTWSRDQDKLD